jgi:diphthine synthase
MLNHDFGNPPHTLVFPGELHFVEAEALVALADAPKKVLEKI